MNMDIAGVVFSPAFFNVFDSLAIIVFIPLVDNYLYPFIEKKLGRQFRIMDKFSIGLPITAAAMFSAGFLEIARQNAPTLAATNGFVGGVDACCAGCVWKNDGMGGECNRQCGNQTVSRVMDGINTTVMAYDSCEYNSYCKSANVKPMKDISIFWQMIPYALVGLGEIFMSIPAYDLFYNEVGPEIRSVSQGVNLLSTSMGSFAAGGFQTMFQDWLPEDLNSSNAHIANIFFIVAALCIIAFGALKVLQSSYTYRDQRDYIQATVDVEAKAQKHTLPRQLSSYFVQKT